MRDFPGNSQKVAQARSESPKIEQVTSSEAIRRKQKLGSRFKDAFIGGSARDALEYVITDVVVPAVQDTLIDAFQGGIERMIRGETRARRTPSPYANIGSRVAYNQMSPSTSNRSSTPRTLSRQARARHNFDDIIIPSRTEAAEVLEQLCEVISHDGDVRVGALYELTGITPTHNDYTWGWTSLAGARLVRMRDGKFLLDLPKPESF